MRVESTLLVVQRSLADARVPPISAQARYSGGTRASTLERINPQAVHNRFGSDPTLLYALPNRAGRLVVWAEAWWWRLVNGIDPLSDPECRSSPHQ